jgi:cytochrome P450
MHGKNVEPDWDPIGLENTADPLAVHADLRATCPVPHSDRWGGFFTLTKHEDIEHAARDTETFISSVCHMLPYMDAGRPQLPLQADPPDHFAYRSIIQPYFARGRVRAMEPAVRRMVVDLVDDMVDEGHTDAGPRLTQPLPASVLCLFLGLPDEDWPKLGMWTLNFMRAASSGDKDAIKAAADAMLDYTRGLMEKRRDDPQDAADDVMTGLLQAELNGRPLTEDEILGYFLVLLKAGHETTTNGLGNSIRILAEDPELQDELRSHPEKLATAVEEFLRFRSPVQGLARTVKRDTVMRGTKLEVGDRVVLLFASGSRDEDQFENADQCVIDRQPNRHLAFGTGIHRCVGADLARLEIRVALEELLARTDSFRLSAPVVPSMWPTLGVRSVSLEITPAGSL